MGSIFRLSKFLWYIILYLATMAMMITISHYSTFETTVGFFKYKQALLGNIYWRVFFYIHVFTAFACLFAGLTQFSNWFLTHQTQAHRIIGKIYIFNILFINFPVGLVLSLFANGGISGKIAFSILDILWFYFTLKALIFIKRGEIQSHKEFMIRSYALTLSALTLRAWSYFFRHYSTLSYDIIYIIDAWLGFTLFKPYFLRPFSHFPAIFLFGWFLSFEGVLYR